MPISLVTWNTQGNPLGNPDKELYLRTMCNQYDAVLLQECGAFTGIPQYYGKQVLGYEQAGAFNNRCSTAIVTNRPDDSGVWTGSSTGRPGIWVKIGNLFIATIHCTSGGVGLTDLMPFMRHMAATAAGNPVVIGGDFNCSLPDGTTTLNAGSSSRAIEFDFHTQGRATHSGGLILDNFVSQNLTLSSGPRRHRTGVSDHHAVSAEFR